MFKGFPKGPKDLKINLHLRQLFCRLVCGGVHEYQV